MIEFTPPKKKPYDEWIAKAVKYAKCHNLKPARESSGIFGVYSPPNNDAKILMAYVDGLTNGNIDSGSEFHVIMQTIVAKCDKPKVTIINRIFKFIFGR